ncbi:uncharacterized protein RCH25_006565 [Pelodytes ibericus]
MANLCFSLARIISLINLAFLFIALLGDDCAAYLGSDLRFHSAQACILSFCSGTCWERYCSLLPGSQLDQSQIVCIINNLYMVIGLGIAIILLIAAGIITCFCKSCCLCFQMCNRSNQCSAYVYMGLMTKGEQQLVMRAMMKMMNYPVFKASPYPCSDVIHCWEPATGVAAATRGPAMGRFEGAHWVACPLGATQMAMDFLRPAARFATHVAVTNVNPQPSVMPMAYAMPVAPVGYQPVPNHHMYAGQADKAYMPPPYPGADNMAFMDSP